MKGKVWRDAEIMVRGERGECIERKRGGELRGERREMRGRRERERKNERMRESL